MRMRALLVLAAALLPLTTPGTAFADVGQMPDASRVNAADIAAYSLAGASNNTRGEVTCSTPTVLGAPVLVATKAGVGETYGIDGAAGLAGCLSLQGTTYSAKLVVSLQFQPRAGAPFEAIPGCVPSSSTVGDIDGVAAPVVPVATCRYDVRSIAYDKPHRAYAVLTHTVDPDVRYESASPVVWHGGVPPLSVADNG
jgi:hypothetical protein